MANSKLAKKKQARRSPEELNLDDVSSDDEWIMENVEGGGENEGLDVDNLDLDTQNPNENEDTVEVQVGDDEGGLPEPPLDEAHLANLDEGDGEDEGIVDVLSDYDFNLRDLF